MLRAVVEVCKLEVREVIRRFLLHPLSESNRPRCLPRVQPEQLDEVRALMLANNEKVMAEMARHASETSGRQG